MEFCATCGTRLTYEKSKGKKLALYCPKCKKKFDSGVNEIKKEKKAMLPKNDHTDGIVLIDKKAQKLRTLPIVDADCFKCKGKKAETWKLDLGSEDNMQAIFYRCTRCGHTWRETD
jgi:DNA-directed RNA polymerase subunit M